MSFSCSLCWSIGTFSHKTSSKKTISSTSFQALRLRGMIEWKKGEVDRSWLRARIFFLIIVNSIKKRMTIKIIAQVTKVLSAKERKRKQVRKQTRFWGFETGVGKHGGKRKDNWNQLLLSAEPFVSQLIWTFLPSRSKELESSLSHNVKLRWTMEKQSWRLGAAPLKMTSFWWSQRFHTMQENKSCHWGFQAFIAKNTSWFLKGKEIMLKQEISRGYFVLDKDYAWYAPIWCARYAARNMVLLSYGNCLTDWANLTPLIMLSKDCIYSSWIQI